MAPISTAGTLPVLIAHGPASSTPVMTGSGGARVVQRVGKEVHD
jgi:hypothetical protein